MFIAPVWRAISIYLEPCVADYLAIRRQVRFIGDIVSGISLKRYFSNIVGANVFVVDTVRLFALDGSVQRSPKRVLASALCLGWGARTTICTLGICRKSMWPQVKS